ncbi:MAG TPA: TetR/AcrR family transcriptional regulator [Solirubrobacteraceae bacterium]|jgi:AcrR family transcriptional regulator
MSNGRGGGGQPGLIWLREEPGARRAAHSRAEIASVAVAIADEEGFDAVSMRRVAQALGAGTMTLYHYVRNKDELLTLMHDAVMGEVLVPEGELPEGWRAAMTSIALRSRASFQRHPWTLDRVSDTAAGPNGVRHFEQSLEAMESAGLPVEERLHVLSLVDEYVFGFTLRETIDFVPEEDGADFLWPAETLEFFQRELDTGAYPHINALFEDEEIGAGGDANEGVRRIVAMISRPERFEHGLAQLLDGVEAGMARPPGKRNGAGRRAPRKPAAAAATARASG